MDRETKTLTIVFADISGSTQLYEDLGDGKARRIVAEQLSSMTQQVETHGGCVIKTIGDELMCTFPTVDSAVEAAMAMQEDTTGSAGAASSMSLRIGLHHGPVLVENNDVFGDAVNLAARVAGLAKGDQILTTRESAGKLDPRLGSATRHVDTLSVKGKSSEIDLYEIVWQVEDATFMATGLLEVGRAAGTLTLSYRDRRITLDRERPSLTLGRGQQAGLVVADDRASRLHARIECRRGKFILCDVSTNGTYVNSAGRQIYLRREELALTDRGRIALGRDFSGATEIVDFVCE